MGTCSPGGTGLLLMSFQFRNHRTHASARSPCFKSAAQKAACHLLSARPSWRGPLQPAQPFFTRHGTLCSESPKPNSGISLRDAASDVPTHLAQLVAPRGAKKSGQRVRPRNPTTPKRLCHKNQLHKRPNNVGGCPHLNLAVTGR